jgi:hypothetical protein
MNICLLLSILVAHQNPFADGKKVGFYSEEKKNTTQERCDLEQVTALF